MSQSGTGVTVIVQLGRNMNENMIEGSRTRQPIRIASRLKKER